MQGHFNRIKDWTDAGDIVGARGTVKKYVLMVISIMEEWDDFRGNYFYTILILSSSHGRLHYETCDRCERCSAALLYPPLSRTNSTLPLH